MLKKLLFVSLITIQIGVFAGELHHQVHVRFELLTHEIFVTDTIIISSEKLDENKSFLIELNRNLHPEVLSADFSLSQVNKNEDPNHSLINTYRITANIVKTELINIPVRYYGRFEENIQSGINDVVRGFSQTSGIIDTKGVYLTGASVWIPRIENTGLFTFDLTVDLEESWNVVSQGTRTFNFPENGRRIVRYDSPDPMDEIYLIAGNWTEYSLHSENILVQAFLRTPDEQLANKYLKATKDYIRLYNDLIGPYPYTKFALVENFWETGFGMPSFTLLGERIIRFPWIINTSYPHEFLHNYWGNSVFVDYSKGNWCEGITAYMADHLIKEQQGEGAEYRRSTLQNFTNYVNADNDFPVSLFRSRNNPAEEAIGYGKTMMINEMLRSDFGDEIYKKAYSKFYKDYKFKYASFDDIRLCFEELTKQDLKPFFNQWINGTGAPSIKLTDAEVIKNGNRYELKFQLQQVQKEDIFRLNIPLAVYLENKMEVFATTVQMDARENSYILTFDSRPLKISVDPEYNLMRRLDRSEMPATLSQLFGNKNSVIILPKSSEYADDYKLMALMWKKMQMAQGREMEIIDDENLEELPTDKAVWVLGFENRFYDQVKLSAEYNNYLSKEEQEMVRDLISDNSLIYAIPNSCNFNQTIGFIGTNQRNAISGLTNKLTHYGNYGYLGFEGEAPDNVLKGIFPAIHSEMDFVFKYPDNPPIKSTLIKRKALADISK